MPGKCKITRQYWYNQQEFLVRKPRFQRSISCCCENVFIFTEGKGCYENHFRCVSPISFARPITRRKPVEQSIRHNTIPSAAQILCSKESWEVSTTDLSGVHLMDSAQINHLTPFFSRWWQIWASSPSNERPSSPHHDSPNTEYMPYPPCVMRPHGSTKDPESRVAHDILCSYLYVVRLLPLRHPF